MQVECKKNYRYQDIFFFLTIGFIWWKFWGIFSYNVLIKIVFTIVSLAISLQGYTKLAPFSFIVWKDKIIFKNLIGTETLFLNKIIDIKRVKWGEIRYEKIYIIVTKNKRRYLNNNAYKNLDEGISRLKEYMELQ